MCKKIFLLGVCIVGVFLNAYPQNKGGGLESKTIMKEKPKIKVIPGIGLNVSTAPVPYDEIIKSLDLEAPNSSMDIHDITFSNSDSVGTIINDYGTNIYSLEAKYIGAKVKYKGLSTEKKEIPLKIKIISDDGSIIVGRNAPDGFSFLTDVTIVPGNNYLTINGFGNNRGNPYQSGNYTYEVWHGSRKLFSKVFKIFPQTPKLYNSSYLKINSLHFINKEKEGRIISNENESLYSHNMRFLAEIINYEGLCNTEQKLSYHIRIFEPNGNLSANRESPIGYTYKTVIPVRPGLNKYLMETIWGNNSKSVFEKGTYIFEIWENSKKIYETTFNVK